MRKFWHFDVDIFDFYILKIVRVKHCSLYMKPWKCKLFFHDEAGGTAEVLLLSVCFYNMIRKCKHSAGIIIWVKFFAQLGAKRSAPNCPIFTCEKVLIFCLCFNSLSFIAFTHHYRARRIKGTRKYLWSYTLSSKGNNIFE